MMILFAVGLLATAPKSLFRSSKSKRQLDWWLSKDHLIFFTPEGGEAYLSDLPKAEMHRLDAGHFAVEDSLNEIAEGMHRFYIDHVRRASRR